MPRRPRFQRGRAGAAQGVSRRPFAAARMRRRASAHGIGVTAPESTSASRRWASSAHARSTPSSAGPRSSRLSSNSATTAARSVAGSCSAAAKTCSTSFMGWFYSSSRGVASSLGQHAARRGCPTAGRCAVAASGGDDPRGWVEAVGTIGLLGGYATTHFLRGLGGSVVNSRRSHDPYAHLRHLAIVAAYRTNATSSVKTSASCSPTVSVRDTSAKGNARNRSSFVAMAASRVANVGRKDTAPEQRSPCESKMIPVSTSARSRV